LSLSSSIDGRLWLSVRAAYESSNYSGAIIEATYYLSDLIRNKSGLDSDGAQLVNDAFAGVSPIIRVNTLHTQSDRDEQKGVHLLLLGFYTAIRNPRSHEKRSDTVETADALISFVNYLTGLIDKARSPFDAEQMVEKVLDPLFGPSAQYADLIVAQIPKRKLLDIGIQVFRHRGEAPETNLELFFKSAMKVLSDDEQASFWRVVSEDLEIATEHSEFISIIRIAKTHWDQVSEIARLRTEHLLIGSVREGEYDATNQMCAKGVLGTWAAEISTKMVLKKEYANAVAGRILSHHPKAREYAFQYHFSAVRGICPEPSRRLVDKLRELLGAKDSSAYYALSFVSSGNRADDKWVAALEDSYKACASHFEISDDDIPF
jgi:uncharacterized protein (TIGR02391 family)